MASANKLAQIKRLEARALPAATPSNLQAHVVSWVGQRGNRVAAAIHDPEPLDEHELPPLNTARLVKTYYAPLLSILHSNSDWNDNGEQLVSIEGADYSIGLHPKIAWLLRNNDFEQVFEVLRHFNGSESTSSSLVAQGYGPDGIRVVPGESWPQEDEN